jgi:hypothetical protein
LSEKLHELRLVAASLQFVEERVTDLIELARLGAIWRG